MIARWGFASCLHWLLWLCGSFSIASMPMRVLAAACSATAADSSSITMCKKVIAAPVVQNYHISYFVGAPIRAEAIIQKTMQQDPQYQSFLQYKQNLAAIQAQKEAPPAPTPIDSILQKEVCVMPFGRGTQGRIAARWHRRNLTRTGRQNQGIGIERQYAERPSPAHQRGS